MRLIVRSRCVIVLLYGRVVGLSVSLGSRVGSPSSRDEEHDLYQGSTY